MAHQNGFSSSSILLPFSGRCSGVDRVTPNFSHTLSTTLGLVTHLRDPEEVFYSRAVNLKEIWVLLNVQDDEMSVGSYVFLSPVSKHDTLGRCTSSALGLLLMACFITDGFSSLFFIIPVIVCKVARNVLFLHHF